MGGGGALGKVTEVATGGMVKSGKTKREEDKVAEATAIQQNLLAKQKEEIKKEEEQRKARVLKARQGRRGLLYSGTGETGVAKSTTLGG